MLCTRRVLSRAQLKPLCLSPSVRPLPLSCLPTPIRPRHPASRQISTTPPTHSTGGAVKLTVERYPHLKRDPRFKKIDAADVEFFRTVVGSKSVITAEEPDELEPFNQDWMRRYKGSSSLVLRPTSTAQVSEILSYCNTHRIAVVPQGGNTGLVGGSVPVHDEVVLSLGNMNKVVEFDEVAGVLTCEAGCVLEVLDKVVGERGYMMPLDLGAKGSCQIGGNVATNAGGLRLLRYGSLHGTVLSMEVVLADGRIVELGKPLRKDNTGYDLKQLFIGSEGTLGVITKVSILTPVRPSSVHVALFAVPSFSHVVKLFRAARTDLTEILSAFEFFDATSFTLVKHHIHGIRDPFSTSTSSSSPFYVLIETAGSHSDHDTAKLDAFFERVFENDIVEDGAVAQDEAQAKAMWSIRESITEALAKEGGNYKYDLSVPVERLWDIVTDVRAYLTKVGVYAGETGAETTAEGQPRFTHIAGFGHMGDGNLHLNLTSTGYHPTLDTAIEPYLYKLIQRHEGSISAEHGLGLMKAPYLGYSKSEEFVALMRSVKGVFDPRGVLNPYKYFPKQEEGEGITEAPGKTAVERQTRQVVE